MRQRRRSLRQAEVARHIGNEQPGAGDRQAEDGVEGERHAGRRGGALLALEFEDRVEVAEEDGQRDQPMSVSLNPICWATMTATAPFSASPIRVIGAAFLLPLRSCWVAPGFARAVGARISQAERPGRDHGEGTEPSR